MIYHVFQTQIKPSLQIMLRKVFRAITAVKVIFMFYSWKLKKLDKDFGGKLSYLDRFMLQNGKLVFTYPQPYII